MFKLSINRLLLAFTALLISSAVSLSCCASTIADIQRYFLTEDLREIQSAGESIPIIDIAPNVPLTRGVALMFIATQSQSMNFNTAEELGYAFKEKGWRTVVIPVDTSSLAPLPPITNSEEKPVKSMLNPPFGYDEYKMQVVGLTNAAYAYAQQYSGYTLIVANGMTAAALMDAFHNKLLNAPDTLISVSPFWPARAQNRAIIDWLGKSTYPILDISWSGNNYWQLDTVSERKDSAVVNFKLHYRQRHYLNNQTSGLASNDIARPSNSWLASEIYGWIRFLGW